ncbi:MAG: DUF3047 domain-containing protein [Candidatus Tectimicrobiota bacterium]
MLRAYYASLLRLSNAVRWCAARSTLWLLCLGMLAALSAVPALRADARLGLGRFSAALPGGGLPEGWEPLLFKNKARQTQYTLVAEQSTVVLRASSSAAASGVKRDLEIDPRLYPRLQWRWKVAEGLRHSDVRRKESDDAAARVSVAFAYHEQRVSWLDRAEFELARSLYGQYPPLATVMYVWERQLPAGTLAPSPYTKRVQTFVLRNNVDAYGSWYHEERNVYEDYQRAFGGTPPLITGVALMTDTDNTGESATAYYGDIHFLPAGP